MKINILEKAADKLHSKFLKILYSEENIDFKEFAQTEFIALFIGDTICEAERLSLRYYCNSWIQRKL